MATDGPTNRSRALRAVLIEEVEQSNQRQPGSAPRDGARGDRPRFDGVRVAVTTSVVLALVVAASAAAIGLRPHGAGQHGTHPAATPVSTTTPHPGQVLAVLSSEDGSKQTRRISPNGMSPILKITCSGGGRLFVSIPHYGRFGTACQGRSRSQDGPSNKGLPGTVPLHVSASEATKWTIRVTVAAPTYVVPQPIANPTTSAGTPAPYCDSSVLRATYRSVKTPNGVTEADGGEIDLLNTGPTACTLYGSPTLQFLDRDGQPIGRRSNERADQRGLSFKTVSPVVLRAGGDGHAYVELDYYDKLFFTNNPANGPCTFTEADSISIDLADPLATSAQHGTLVAPTGPIPACTQPTLQLFGTDYVDYRMTPGK